MIGQVGASRPQYYDRGSTITANSYGAGVAPHASTERWAYTVPSGKKAFIERLYARIFRLTAAAPVGTVQISVGFTPSGGARQLASNPALGTNAVGDHVESESAQFGLIGAGDKIDTQTSDASTGGTVSYVSSEKHTEFDA